MSIEKEGLTFMNYDANDLLRGAAAISKFIFGSEAKRRRIYHLFENKQLPPAFTIGSEICARKSTLSKWIESKEEQE